MENDKVLELKSPIPVGMLNGKIYEDCEWCFQFGEDEPQVFAWTDEHMGDEIPQIQFTIQNKEHANISFTHKNGKVFKIFAREMTEVGKEMQTKQKLFKNDIES